MNVRVCACVWLPAGWCAGQWSSEADWLVDRLVEIIGQMTLELPHRETGTYSCDYSSYTHRENTHNQVITKWQPLATFVVFVLSVHLIVLIKRKNRHQCLRLTTNTVKSRRMLWAGEVRRTELWTAPRASRGINTRSKGCADQNFISWYGYFISR